MSDALCKDRHEIAGVAVRNEDDAVDRIAPRDRSRDQLDNVWPEGRIGVGDAA
jgi:hypothetical protein